LNSLRYTADMTKTISIQFGPKMEKTWLDMFDKVLSSCHYCACLLTSLFLYCHEHTGTHTHAHTHTHTHYCDEISSFRIQYMGAIWVLFFAVMYYFLFKHVYILKCCNNIKIHDAVLNKHHGK